MDLQLELLPHHYYYTLGFDAKLIDYINHVDNSIVLEKIAPLYKDGGCLRLTPGSVFGCMICTAYWTSLRGLSETENVSSVTISIPRHQIFNVASVQELMERVARREPL